MVQISPVVSSNIAGIGFDKESETLRVEFHNGSAFEYFDVPESLHAEFMQSESKGRFFAQNIKDRYQSQKVAG
jgi:hypothetical protein